MRRIAPLLLAVASLWAPRAAAAQEPQWISYITSDEEFAFAGGLSVVRADGSGGRELLPQRVVDADLGPNGTVYAAVEGETEIQDAAAPSDLVRMPASGGEPESILDEADDYVLGVAASAQGDLAYFRHLNEVVEPPAFLGGALEGLAQTNVPILLPPEEPEGTGGVVVDAESDLYSILFTNDPDGELSHAEQRNVAITGQFDPPESPPETSEIPVRNTTGLFSCGASACFLGWEEGGVFYTVGEFGSPEEAAGFADSLVSVEELAGSSWREGDASSVPELVVRDAGGEERFLERISGFCECGFLPLDWSPEGDRLLVVTTAEGYTTLQEYRADGTGEPETLAEGSHFEGGQVLDAGYWPQGVLVLVGGEGGPPGTLQTEDGDVMIEDVRSFDVSGTQLVYAAADGAVMLRDLMTETDTKLGEGAFEVSIGPAETVPTEPAEETTPPQDVSSRPVKEGLPPAVLVGIGAAAMALIGGMLLVFLGRRRARR